MNAMIVLLFRAVFHGSIEIEIDPVLEVSWYALNYCPKFLVINNASTLVVNEKDPEL